MNETYYELHNDRYDPAYEGALAYAWYDFKKEFAQVYEYFGDLIQVRAWATDCSSGFTFYRYDTGADIYEWEE
jgi:hypothetical protein